MKPSEPYSPAADFESRYVKPKDGKTLIVGSKMYPGRIDRRALFKDAIGVDMLGGDGVDVVANLESATATKWLGSFDHIECLSVLEHSRRPWKLASNLEGALKRGGTLFLSVPFIWRYHGYPSDYFRFTAEGLRSLFPRIVWTELLYGTEKELFSKPLSRRVSATEKLDDEDEKTFVRTEVFGFGVKG